MNDRASLHSLMLPNMRVKPAAFNTWVAVPATSRRGLRAER